MIRFSAIPYYKLLCTCLLLLLASCGSNTGNEVSRTPAVQSTSVRVDQLMRDAELLDSANRANLLLMSARQFLDESELQATEELLEATGRPDRLIPEHQLRFAMLQARLAQQKSDDTTALRWLEGSLTQSADPATAIGAEFYYQLGTLYEERNNITGAVAALAEASAYYVDDQQSDIYDRIWRELQSLSDPMLDQLAADASSYELRGWIELERVYREDEFSLSSQLDAISRWQSIWSSHPATQRLPSSLARLQESWEQRPQHIALVLPLTQPAGLAIQEGFLSAYYQALAESRTQPQISVLDSTEIDNVLDIYNDASELGVDLVIGPLSKTLVNQLQRMDRLPITTLALNYLDNPGQLPGNLYQFGLAPEDEINQAARLAWSAGYRNAALVTPQSQDYLRLQNVFQDIWESLGGHVVSAASFADTNDYSDVVKRLMAIDSSEARAERILDLLPRNSMEFTPRRRQDIDFIFLIANPRQGRLIKPTLAFYFAEDVPVYALPSIYDGQLNANENRDLDGIWFTDAPWLLEGEDALKTTVDSSLRSTLGPLQRLRALGIDSFRLYARLGMLSSGQLDGLSGTTGRLSIAEDGRIQRGLLPAKFIDGRAEIQSINTTGSDD